MKLNCHRSLLTGRLFTRRLLTGSLLSESLLTRCFLARCFLARAQRFDSDIARCRTSRSPYSLIEQLREWFRPSRLSLHTVLLEIVLESDCNVVEGDRLLPVIVSFHAKFHYRSSLVAVATLVLYVVVCIEGRVEIDKTPCVWSSALKIWIQHINLCLVSQTGFGVPIIRAPICVS